MLQDNFLDDLWVVLVFQEAQAFEAQNFGEEGLVDVAVGGFYIIAPCDAISLQRAAARAPVAPLAIAAAFFFFHRNILYTQLVSTNH